MRFNNFITILYLALLGISIIIKLLLDIINYRHRKKYQNTIPEDLKEYVNKEKLVLINNYSNEKLIFSLVEYFFDKVLLLIILLSGLIPFYHGILIKIFKNNYINALALFGSFYFIQLILSLPFSLYYNFVIEKKFDFNKMTPLIWITDLLKRIILTVIIGCVIITALIFFIQFFGNIWWILLWAFFFVFSLFIQIIYPTVIAPLFNKFKPLENIELKNKIEELLKRSNLKPGGIFEMDASKRSSHSNAYFTGIGKTKRIVLFDSLLEKHSDEEILAILAHEIGHFKHKHVLKNMILSMCFSLAAFFVCFLLINNRMIYSAFGFNHGFDLESFSYIGIFLISILAGPIGFFFTPISSIISRIFEFQADKYSFLLIKNSIPLINALKKLSIDNLGNIYPAKIYSWFYYSHPPVLERIKYLKNISMD